MDLKGGARGFLIFWQIFGRAGKNDVSKYLP